MNTGVSWQDSRSLASHWEGTVTRFDKHYGQFWQPHRTKWHSAQHDGQWANVAGHHTKRQGPKSADRNNSEHNSVLLSGWVLRIQQCKMQLIGLIPVTESTKLPRQGVLEKVLRRVVVVPIFVISNLLALSVSEVSICEKISCAKFRQIIDI